jgi:hypothetical protein
MQNSKFRAIALAALAFIFMLSIILVPATPVRADDGGWGDCSDADGNILLGVIEGGEVTMPADWMPTFPAWTGIEMDATYNVMTSENGSSVLIPSMTTLFFMALNPVESGLTDANGMLGSGPGGLLLAGGLVGGNNVSLSNLFQALTGMSQVQADQFADAAIAGNGDVWSLFNPFDGQTDLTILMELLQTVPLGRQHLSNGHALRILPDRANRLPGRVVHRQPGGLRPAHPRPG